ncbi:MAG: AmmeMemoRadiSam system protein A [Ardenticatenaceae bacterium]|nr:AmmeMemoRadiSam system protein A [Anaerolineales bacterium]MCB8923847.1 AmmeMemoRadiSam system protein A [Ardenticatenaceae bacterium]MCB9003374.1 AmmeMemoRadiSam system protein A [Ardenticatenaceae bacterium]
MSKQVQMLDTEMGVQLVQIARRSLEQYVRHKQHYSPDLNQLPHSVCQPGCSFVTLTDHGWLRGCIGNTQARWALAEDVARNAVAAASRDPRFSPVTSRELEDIRLEVTLLTPPQELTYHTYEDLLGKLRPRVDGVMLTWDLRRGLLLPQVWDRIPEPVEFLRAITHKAGIPQHELMMYPPTISVHTFQVQHFHEPGYQEPGG